MPVIRWPDVVVGLLFLRCYLFVSSFFFRQLPSDFTEWNSAELYHMLGSGRFENARPGFGCPLRLQIWSPKLSLSRRQLWEEM